MTEVRVWQPPSFPRTGLHSLYSVAFLREGPARRLPDPCLYPSASLPGSVTPHPRGAWQWQGAPGLVLVHAGQGPLCNRKWMAQVQVDWLAESAESTSRWPCAKACSDCSHPRSRESLWNSLLKSICIQGESLCNSLLHPGEGKGLDLWIAWPI